jgi:dolichol kinase
MAQTRKTVSWPRKLFHFGMIATTGLVVALSGLPHGVAVAIMAVAALVLGGLDVLRLVSPRWNERCRKEFAAILRREEECGLATSTWFLLGAVATMMMAPLPFAGLAFLYLAAGDPVASWVGVRFGRIKLPGGKSLEGSLALVGVCSVLGTLFLGLTGAAAWHAAPLLAMAGAFAAAAAEWLPLGFVDDNFRVPVATAATFVAVAAMLMPPVLV